MKNTPLKFPLIVLCMLMASVFVIQSCGDDDVEGCTDINAENYDPEATIDNNTCIYARDKFIGEYVAVFTCPGTLAFISNDSLPVIIEPAIDPDDTDGIILSLFVNGGAIPLRGTVEGNTLVMMDELMDVVIPDVPLVGTITGDVMGTGTATLSTDETVLTGNVMVSVSAAGLPFTISDDCTIVGTKQ